MSFICMNTSIRQCAEAGGLLLTPALICMEIPIDDISIIHLANNWHGGLRPKLSGNLLSILIPLKCDEWISVEKKSQSYMNNIGICKEM